MTGVTLSVVGLLGSKEDADEVKLISKVFLTSIHIHELVEKALASDIQMVEKVDK